jgi:hypothetical protein
VTLENASAIELQAPVEPPNPIHVLARQGHTRLASILRDLVAQAGSNITFRTRYLSCLASAAMLAAINGKQDEALETIAEAVRQSEYIRSTNPGSSAAHVDCARIHLTVADLLAMPDGSPPADPARWQSHLDAAAEAIETIERIWPNSTDLEGIRGWLKTLQDHKPRLRRGPASTP